MTHSLKLPAVQERSNNKKSRDDYTTLTLATLNYGEGADLALDTHSAFVNSTVKWTYETKLAQIVLRTDPAQQHELLGYELQLHANLMASGKGLNEKLERQRQKFVDNGLIINGKAADIIDVRKRTCRTSIDNLISMRPVKWLRECVAAAEYKI